MRRRSGYLVAAAVFLLGPGLSDRNVGAHGKNHNPLRYDFVMKDGIPKAYRSLENPLTPNADDLAGGAGLYAEYCASCHGATGEGDGPDAKNMKPPPPELRSMMSMMSNMPHGPGMRGHGPGMMGQGRGMMGRGGGMMRHRGQGAGMSREMSMMTEGYLFWTISEGGERLGTAMPGFKDVLSEKERWQIILFMSNGFRAK